MITYGLQVSAATNSSLNTAFSLVASDLPLSYQLKVWNTTSGTVGVAFATSLPTYTTTEQHYVPAGDSYADDSNHGMPCVPKGMNLYLRVATTSIVSNMVYVDLSN